MTNNTQSLAIIMGGLYLAASFLSVILIVLNTPYFIMDPIEILILILISIIFIRGFYHFRKSNDSVGNAYIFVGLIIGFLLGVISLLNLLINGILGGFIEEESINDLVNRIQYYITPTMLLGFLSFYFHKLMPQHQQLL